MKTTRFIISPPGSVYAFPVFEGNVNFRSPFQFPLIGGCLKGLIACSLLVFINSIASANNFNEVFGNGFPRLNKTNFSLTISNLDSIILHNPTNPAPLISKIIVYTQIGQYGKALDICNKIMRDCHKPFYMYVCRGGVFYSQGKYDHAIADFDGALRLKRVSLIFFYRARAYEGKMDYEKALNDLTDALLLKPGDARIYMARAECFSLTERFANAVDDYNHVIDAYPRWAEAYGERGLVYFEMGNFGHAINDCEEGYRRDPYSAAICNNLAWVLAVCPSPTIRDDQKALLIAKKACEFSIWKNAYCLGTYASACAGTGDFEDAVKWEKKAIKVGFRDKDLPQAREMLALYKRHKLYFPTSLQSK